MIYKAPLAILVLAATIASAAGIPSDVIVRETKCKNLNLEEHLDDKKSVLGLYDYAALTEYAFERSTHECANHPHRNKEEPWHVSADVTFFPLFDDDVDVINMATEGIVGSIGYSTDNGAYILACRRQQSGVPLLGFRIERVLKTGTYHTVVTRYNDLEESWYVFEPREGREVVFSFQPYIITRRSFFDDLGYLIGEKIQTQSLRLVTPDADHAVEDAVAIRGTQFSIEISKILDTAKQINASIQDIIGASCAFDMAAILVRIGHEMFSADKLTVTGHSLGGAVAQFIAYDRAKDPYAYRINDFGAFSFNAIGIKNPLDIVVRDLISFHLEGDIVSELVGMVLGREQAGIDFRCIPPPSFSEGRHGISEIQQALCLCLSGEGRTVVTSDRTGR